MDAQPSTDRQSRFGYQFAEEFHSLNNTPIYGYEDQPLVSLRQAMEPLLREVHGLDQWITTSLNQSDPRKKLLMQDEMAAIYLYTMPIIFFKKLNKTLRQGNRLQLESWLPFLKLFITALNKLDDYEGPVYRCVRRDIADQFNDGTDKTWLSFNSCSKVLKLAEAYLDHGGTLVMIQVFNGKDISSFSAFPEEEEILLLPGCRFRLLGGSANPVPNLHLLSIEQIGFNRGLYMLVNQEEHNLL